MRIIDALLGRSNRTRRDDPVFGSMIYMGDRLGYWEGRANFAPLSSEIEVFVNGAKDDEMNSQHEFFEKVQKDWSHLSLVIEQAVANERQNFESHSAVSQIWQRAKLASLTIPKDRYEEADWQVTLEEEEPPRLWTVRMKGRQPQAVTMDD